MITRNLYPLISCICITYNRPAFLLKSIISFDSQNYPNREMVISYPANDTASRQLVEDITKVSKLNIVVIEREPKMSIGKARNQAIADSNGEYFCTWDDDDWYRDARLMFQYTILRSLKQKREACILTTVLLYDGSTGQSYYSGQQNWAGTLLCKKEIAIQYPYIDSNIGEERDLLQYLDSSKYVHYFADYGLYAFIYHGKNNITYEQFSNFFQDKQVLDQETQNWLSSEINKQFNLASN